MSNNLKHICAALLLLGAFVLPAHAQDEGAPAREAIKARILARVLEVKHQKLRETLLMDDEQAKKFFAEYDPAEKDMIELVKQKQAQEAKLLELTQGGYKDADVDPTIENIKGLNKQIADRYEQLDNSLKSVLSPRQRAKMLVFEHEFNRIAKEKVRDRIQEWKENHPGKRPFRGKPGAKPDRPGKKG